MISCKKQPLGFPQIDFNKYSFNVLWMLMQIQYLAWFIFPDIQKNTTSVSISLKSKALRITFDKKLVRQKRGIQFTFSKNQDINFPLKQTFHLIKLGMGIRKNRETKILTKIWSIFTTVLSLERMYLRLFFNLIDSAIKCYFKYNSCVTHCVQLDNSKI